MRQRLAHAAVAKAIQEGKLPQLNGKVSCVDCGKPAKQYDHRDYDYPLLVVPVCQRCNISRGQGANGVSGYSPRSPQLTKEIGKSIRLARTSQKLSQSAIQKKSGLTRTYISRLENGHTQPSVTTLYLLAVALDVPVGRLLP